MAKILVTGAAGHIGSRVIRGLLSEDGNEVVALDNFLTSRFSSMFGLAGESRFSLIDSSVLDVSPEDLSSRALDVVIHLAAMTDATNSLGHREAYLKHNLGLTQRVIEWCKFCSIPLIFASSTSVYGESEGIVTEDEISHLNPKTPYAEGKVLEERLITEACEAGMLPGATVFRFGTIYGVSPGMRFHTAVNKFCWEAAYKGKVDVWSSAYNQVRPYLSLDLATSVLKQNIFRNHFKESGFQIYNLLSGNHTVDDVVTEIRKVIPCLEIKFTESPILNQFSYEVSTKKFDSRFERSDGETLAAGVSSTLKVLKGDA